MKDKLKRYFNILNDTELLDSIIKNEEKHLSSEYRSSRDLMADLLHSDFYEKGKSGSVYNKQAILDVMPLASLECRISDFSYDIKGDSLVCTYILNEDNILMNCTSVWEFEDHKLRLKKFSSAYIDE